MSVAINICVLDVNLMLRSQFPLLSTIQTIKVEEFLDRLDVFSCSCLSSAVFQSQPFTYAVVVGVSTLFKEKPVPAGLSSRIGGADSLHQHRKQFSEHMNEGLNIVPIYIHLPFQVLFPVLLLIIAVIKKRSKDRLYSFEEITRPVRRVILKS